jgi:hypothetical protein
MAMASEQGDGKHRPYPQSQREPHSERVGAMLAIALERERVGAMLAIALELEREA